MRDDLPLWVEVDLGRIRRNVSNLRAMLSPGTELLAVVKANAYGHGDVEVAEAAIEAGAHWLGVARVEEGEGLRDAGIVAPILLLAEPPIAALARAVELNLTPTIYREATAIELSRISEGRDVVVHLKVDTGMHRYGVAADQIAGFVEHVSALAGITIGGLWSHFAVAEDVMNEFTQRQLQLFNETLRAIDLDAVPILHLSNSAGAITLPEAHFDMVRTGIAMYGIYPSSELRDRVELLPAMSFKSRVGMVKRIPAGDAISYGQRYTLARDGNVATIPCGYADGLRRALSNEGEVLIRGKRYRICGTITMDHFLVDVGDDEIEVGDEVVMLGRQGEESITADDIARRLGTIPYEVVCGISSRVARIHLD